MVSLANTGVEPNGENLRAKLSDKIKELEQLQENQDGHTIDEINNKLKEIKQLKKDIEAHHELIKLDNLKKQNAEKELDSKIKEMKRLQAAIEEQYALKEQGVKSEARKRRHQKYKLSLNHKALKKLEGITTSSFLALARTVILINGKEYDETRLTLSKERKNDFKRLIEHYSLVEVIGKRKYHIKRVYDKKQQVESNESELTAAYDTPTK